MDQIFQSWRDNYFTEPLLDMLVIITFIVSLRKRKLVPQLKGLPYYLGCFVFLMLASYILSLTAVDTAYPDFFSVSDSFLNYTVSLVEFVSFFYFLHTATAIEKYRLPIRIIGTMGTLFCVFRYTHILTFDKQLGIFFLNSLYSMESGLLLIMSFFCIAYLISSTPIQILPASPDFWVLTGLVIYTIGTLPYKLITNYYTITDPLLFQSFSTIVYFFYIILFLMLLKAYSYVPRQKPLSLQV